ncbi:MAG: acyl-CoA thioesterase [Saccharofermentanales bacterium]
MDSENDFKIYRHKAQYYETDQMKVIHHSNYIRWFEEARVDMLEQAGYGYGQMEEEGISIPVLGVSCDYISMVRYGDTVDIVPKIEFFNGIRMTLSYRVTDSVTGKLKAAGETKHCFLGRDGRPISLQRNNKGIYDVFLKLKAESGNVIA